MPNNASNGISKANLATPMLLDFFKISVRSALPTLEVSRTRLPPICMVPSPVSMMVFLSAIPLASAAKTTKGLTVEPGSNASVITRLRILKLCQSLRLFGL
ncbi:Uncharacterised protein [Vibrio cholerae]|nr:Uncharacterised protein [Vibrio cholerae]CSB36944.1 Uncharacterised protein [Vibrio cholerae]CSC25262.1 Uncharacterised protein [Vibrio cholerae]CSD53006.1 Uncharacterised protein [Vibrio cholerae]CSI75957.1 Uncharacterised protein [Vibrio cholerae]